MIIFREGNYHCVLQLVATLNNGLGIKAYLDHIIDKCDLLNNIREAIIVQRISMYNIVKIDYSISGNSDVLQKAFGFLDRYLFLLAFTSYLDEQNGLFEISFSDWLRSRPEILNMLRRTRKMIPALSAFRPIHDLSVFLDETGQDVWSDHDFHANEMETYTIKSRKGVVLGPYTILKEDYWAKEPHSQHEIVGAANFRQVQNLPVFGVAQPTIQGYYISLTF